MFGKTNNSNVSSDYKGKTGKMETIIGPQTEFNGVLKCTGVVRVDGRVTGKIVAENSTIIVGAEGFVDAGVTAKHMIISGEVHGNLEVQGTLELLSTGKLYGYVTALGLQISDGALFRGNCDMLKTEPKKVFKPDNEVEK
ncbi:polymer-forming cytoskeletal protein [Clostridium sp. 'deep sea']|uniref:bactofilin family protein n=1 Tax=Clostridium sp. 'deep sea' TaxID=2779445 RepID=UPI0018965E3C|nr:polymer-forming cytoskeletal protein [Clostridium sp. 'deep sea']QOR34269.1 polymer-forming cytoskeletal protein [Clostridium sp. 'deep sea']